MKARSGIPLKSPPLTITTQATEIHPLLLPPHRLPRWALTSATTLAEHWGHCHSQFLPPFRGAPSINYKTTTILLDRQQVKLQLWGTSGQGRFCTIFRSYLRGAQGVILVYDIANCWSFDGIEHWIKEIDEHAPGVPKILVGNRLHLAFKRQVPTEQAQAYAERQDVTFFEASPLRNFNITSFTELARIMLLRHGMDQLWRPSKGRC
ncbi:LOW QUALITY PROTEIN: ras-related protein Rab-40B [Rhynchonycteris naso]